MGCLHPPDVKLMLNTDNLSQVEGKGGSTRLLLFNALPLAAGVSEHMPPIDRYVIDARFT